MVESVDRLDACSFQRVHLPRRRELRRPDQSRLCPPREVTSLDWCPQWTGCPHLKRLWTCTRGVLTPVPSALQQYWFIGGWMTTKPAKLPEYGHTPQHLKSQKWVVHMLLTPHARKIFLFVAQTFDPCPPVTAVALSCH